MARSFFDTSALVKHYHAEQGSDVVNRILGEPGAVLFLARLTLVEMTSVFALKARTGDMTVAEFGQVRGRFAADVVKGRFQVARGLNSHYDEAQALIGRHGLSRQLRTLDALQLAVALHLDRLAPLDRFVSSDQKLCRIASAEGLPVVNPELIP